MFDDLQRGDCPRFVLLSQGEGSTSTDASGSDDGRGILGNAHREVCINSAVLFLGLSPWSWVDRSNTR